MHGWCRHRPQPHAAGALTAVGRVFQDVAARGLDLPQVTWILQVSPNLPQTHTPAGL